MVKAAITDIISPAVTSDDPTGTFDKVVLQAKDCLSEAVEQFLSAAANAVLTRGFFCCPALRPARRLRLLPSRHRAFLR